MMKKLFILLILLLPINPLHAACGNFGGCSDNSKLDKDGDDGLIITEPSDGSFPIVVKDSDGNVVFAVGANGNINNKEGIGTEASPYGVGISVFNHGEDVAEHTNQQGYYDHTGGDFEQIFKLTSGDLFTQEDADNGTHILLTGIEGGFPFAEIKTFISGSSVLVDGCGWDQDFGSVGSPTTFFSFKHPGFYSCDKGKHEFSVGSEGQFEIASYDYQGSDTGTTVAEIELDSAANGMTALYVQAEANGYTNNQTIVSIFETGNISSPSQTGGVVSVIDTSGIIAADGSELVSAYVASVVNGSDALKIAYTVQAGFDRAMIVSGAPEIDVEYGYNVASGVVSDRVTGVAPDGTAFLESSSTDITIFDNNADYILIGRSSTFEIIDVSLTTNANVTILPSFEYSTGNGTWSVLPLLADNTGGFTSSGQIAFNAPIDWATGNEAESSGDITAAYYVKITRTRINLVTDPVENYFKLFDNVSAGMAIWGNGVVELPYANAAPDNLTNGMIWMEPDGLHVYYNNTERRVTDTAP